MIDLLLIAVLAQAPPPPEPPPGGDRRDKASTEVLTGPVLTPFPLRIGTDQNSKRINSIMSLSINYVADHIDRIDRRHGGKQDLILDSKWRIASSLEMFGSELKKNGILTLSQLHQVDVYIAKFKSTPGGQEALAQYQRRAS